MDKDKSTIFKTLRIVILGFLFVVELISYKVKKKKVQENDPS